MGAEVCENTEGKSMILRYRFSRGEQEPVIVTLEIREPQYFEKENMWGCPIVWTGLNLAGNHGFGADPLGAIENTITIVRAILEMESRDWSISPAI